MNTLTRVLLLLISTGTFFFIMKKIRSLQVKIDHMIFWILFMLGLIIISIFPGIAFFLSRLFQIETPMYFVFISTIFILLLKVFNLSLQVSKLQHQIQELTQIVALKEHSSANK